MRWQLPLLFAVLASQLWAYNHSVDLKTGQLVVDYQFYGHTKFAYVLGAFDTTNGLVSTVYENVILPVANTPSDQDQVAVEYAVQEGLSLGLKSNLLLGGLVSGFRDGQWNIQASAYGNLRLDSVSDRKPDDLKISWYGEVQLAPLFAGPGYHQQGRLNVFSSLSFAQPLFLSESLELGAYLDAKATVNFPHPFYGENWTSAEQAKKNLDQLGQSYANDLTVVAVPTLTPFVAVGFETTMFNLINLSVGTNLPLGTTVRLSKDQLIWDFSELLFWSPLAEIEFQIKWLIG